MHRLASVLCFVLLLTSVAAGQTQPQKPAPAPSAKQKPSPGFIDRVLKFLGISDSPGTLKSLGDEQSGALWVADLGSHTTHAVARGEGYRSPVFMPESGDILTLSGSDVVRISPSGEMKKLYSIAAITKLVAGSVDNPDTVLILLTNNAGGHPRIGLLSISTGKVTPLAYDPNSGVDLQMVENLEGWTRSYNDKQIYVQRQTKQALSGAVEWSDVFLKSAGQNPVNVSRCNGSNCGQPSLSANGRLLVFVKSEPE
ncbi:MAG: hypothetical protein WBQ94_11495 [Terracidiphilus sp.]